MPRAIGTRSALPPDPASHASACRGKRGEDPRASSARGLKVRPGDPDALACVRAGRDGGRCVRRQAGTSSAGGPRRVECRFCDFRTRTGAHLAVRRAGAWRSPRKGTAALVRGCVLLYVHRGRAVVSRGLDAQLAPVLRQPAPGSYPGALRGRSTVGSASASQADFLPSRVAAAPFLERDHAASVCQLNALMVSPSMDAARRQFPDSAANRAL